MRRNGFTLIELMVVMAIVALLTTIAAPRYFTHLERAREIALRESLFVMRDAIDKFHADTGRYPMELEELVTKRYLRKLPIDPVSESAESWLIVPPPNELAGVWDVKSGAVAEGKNYADW